MEKHNLTFVLEPEDNSRLAILCGKHNNNLRQIEEHFNVEINMLMHTEEANSTETGKAKNIVRHPLVQQIVRAYENG